jgi:hypothetical protein
MIDKCVKCAKVLEDDYIIEEMLSSASSLERS